MNWAPRWLCRTGRGRSNGNSSTGCSPPSRPVQYANWRSFPLPPSSCAAGRSPRTGSAKPAALPRALDYRRHRAGPVPRPSPASTNRRTRCDAGPAPAHGRPRPAATGSPAAAAHAPGRTAARSSSRPAERGRPPRAAPTRRYPTAMPWMRRSPGAPRRRRGENGCVGSRAAQPGCRSCVAGHPGPAAHVDARHSGYGRPRFPAPVARETTVAPGHRRAAGARRPGA